MDDKGGTPTAVPIHTRNHIDSGAVPVVRLNVGGVRAIKPLSVEHEPEPDNRAHTEVFGDKKKDPEVRLKLQRLAEWVIRI